jgi:hypothetical protein
VDNKSVAGAVPLGLAVAGGAAQRGQERTPPVDDPGDVRPGQIWNAVLRKQKVKDKSHGEDASQLPISLCIPFHAETYGRGRKFYAVLTSRTVASSSGRQRMRVRISSWKSR